MCNMYGGFEKSLCDVFCVSMRWRCEVGRLWIVSKRGWRAKECGERGDSTIWSSFTFRWKMGVSRWSFIVVSIVRHKISLLVLWYVVVVFSMKDVCDDGLGVCVMMLLTIILTVFVVVVVRERVEEFVGWC